MGGQVFQDGKIVGFSTPFMGSNAIWKGDNWKKWLTGSIMAEDLNPMYEPPKLDAVQGGPYQVDPSVGQIGNQYTSQFDAMGQQTQGRDPSSIKAAQIAMGPQNQFRRDQRGLVSALQNRAAGQSPSVAEMQMRSGMDRISNEQASQASSARGISPALAARLQADNTTQAQLQTNQQTGQLRAQEMERAEQALGGVLSGARGQDIGLAQAQAGLQQGANQANLGAAMQQKQMNDQMTQYYMSQGLSRDEAAQKAAADLANTELQAQTQHQNLLLQQQIERAKNEKDAKGGVMATIGKIIGGISDERAKTNVRRSSKNIDRMLDKLKASEYDYKPEYGDKGFVGFMAQDLEKSKLGKAMVKTGPDGLKRFDGSRALMAALASNARLHERLKKLEGKAA